MKVRLTTSAAGQDGMQVELEEVCEVSELANVMKAFRQVLGASSRVSSSAAMPPDNRMPRSPRQTPTRPDGDFVPASEGQLKALWAAATNAGKTVEEVCQKYGVDPECISRSDAWRMTRDLNEETGYSQD